MPFKYEQEKREELIKFMAEFFKNHPEFVGLCEGTSDIPIYREYCKTAKAQYIKEFPDGVGYNINRYFGLINKLPYKIKNSGARLEEDLRECLTSKRNRKEID